MVKSINSNYINGTYPFLSGHRYSGTALLKVDALVIYGCEAGDNNNNNNKN